VAMDFFARHDGGTLAVTIQKTGANMQSPKRRGTRAVRGQNKGSYAIDRGVGGGQMEYMIYEKGRKRRETELHSYYT